MTLPLGFYKQVEENIACKLKKLLYGLKQSPRALFDRFAQLMKCQRYRQGHSDHIMFFQHFGEELKKILIQYVDDIILIGDNLVGIERLKTTLATEFEVKDFMCYFLGMKIVR